MAETKNPEMTAEEAAIVAQARSEWATLSTVDQQGFDNAVGNYVAAKVWNAMPAIQAEFKTLATYQAYHQSREASRAR